MFWYFINGNEFSCKYVFGNGNVFSTSMKEIDYDESFSSPPLISHFNIEITILFWNGVAPIQIKLGLEIHGSHLE
jgi:hypothetical protein